MSTTTYLLDKDGIELIRSILLEIKDARPGITVEMVGSEDMQDEVGSSVKLLSDGGLLEGLIKVKIAGTGQIQAISYAINRLTCKGQELAELLDNNVVWGYFLTNYSGGIITLQDFVFKISKAGEAYWSAEIWNQV